MFGGLTGSTNPTGSDWERMLNTVASKDSHLFTQSESVEVLCCHPSSKLLGIDTSK